MSTDGIIRDREELSEQARALQELRGMATGYGFGISGPAANAKEALNLSRIDTNQAKRCDARL